MKVSLLAVALSTFISAPALAAPNPNSIEILLSVDAAKHDATTKEGPPANVIFYAAESDSPFNMLVQADGKTFQIDNKLSVSYISVQGFAGCVFYGVDGSQTYVKSFGIPQTVPVGPPQQQVKGVCKSPYDDSVLEL